jgi:hypothetical protein
VPSNELSTRTRRCIQVLFNEGDRTLAGAALVQDCGIDLPGLGKMDLERIRLAALKTSGGQLPRLYEAIALARTDWRDLLVGAGFGEDATAHLQWMP